MSARTDRLLADRNRALVIADREWDTWKERAEKLSVVLDRILSVAQENVDEDEHICPEWILELDGGVLAQYRKDVGA